MTQTAVVDVKSAWYSKINWVQVVGAVLAGAIALVGGRAFGLDDATTVKILGVLSLIQSTATVVIKTYYTPTVTPSSVS